MYEKTLCYVLDLFYTPYSFDIYHILGVMEYERRYLGLDRIHLIIVPKDVGRAKKEKAQKLTKEDNAWRELRIIVENLYLLKTLKGFSLFHTREEAFDCIKQFQHIYPPVYKTVSPTGHIPLVNFYNHLSLNLTLRWLRDETSTFITSLQPSVVARNYIDRWCEHRVKERKLIVISFREAKYWPERNTSVERWADFCKQLDSSEYAIVVLRDFEKNMEPLPEYFPDVFTLPEAVLAQEIRVALYQRADIVLGDNGGGSAPMLFVPNVTCMYLMRILDRPNISSVSFSALQLAYKNRLLFLPPRQAFIIETDENQVDLFRVFKTFERKMQQPNLQDPQYLEQFMLKQKRKIIEKDVLYKLALDVLSIKDQRASIYMSYMMLFISLRTLPIESTDSLQRLFYALCRLSKMPIAELSFFSASNQRLFSALDGFVKGRKYEAKDLLVGDRANLLKTFSYPDHWTKRLFSEDTTPHLLSVVMRLPEGSIHERVSIFCPVCSFDFHSNGEINSTVTKLFLRENRLYICVNCLEPLQVVNRHLAEIDDIEKVKSKLRAFFRPLQSPVRTDVKDD